MSKLHRLIPEALLRISKLVAGKSGFCVGHSGGKDSTVVHHLCNVLANLNLPVVHTAKASGRNAIHPRTLEFLYSRPFRIELYPEGVPMPYSGQVDGTRASECERSDKSTDLIVNGISINREGMVEYNPCGLFNMAFVYPIYDWTDDDVWEYHTRYSLPRSSEYEESVC